MGNQTISNYGLSEEPNDSMGYMGLYGVDGSNEVFNIPFESCVPSGFIKIAIEDGHV